MELAPLGIDVVAICPGDIKTNFTANRVKDFTTNERYGNRLKTATEKSDGRENKRIPQEVCALKTYKKITKKRCKPFYIIGKKYKFLNFLTRITPKSWLLKITAKLYGGWE
jgi:short-subunit dehydrogenase